MRDPLPSIRRYPLFPHGGAVHADGIVSSSVVGYSGQEVKAGQFYMVAVQFADVGASADVANFNNFFSTTCAPGAYGTGDDGSMDNAPMIEVLRSNGLGYDLYFYISDAYDSGNNPVGGACWAWGSGGLTPVHMHDGKRHARVRRERDEGVAQRVERGDDRLAAASFEANAHGDVRRLEDPPQSLVQLPLAHGVEFGDERIDESAP